MHAMMAFAAAGRTSAVARVFEGLPLADVSGASWSYPEGALAPPLCKALLAFAGGDYAACVEWLIRARNISHRCGGSLAQCDLIHLRSLRRHCVRERRISPARWSRSAQHRNRRAASTGDCSGAWHDNAPC
jgi:hypothetical protein